MAKMNKETEYEKDLNDLKKQILKEGNTLLTKRDLLERFCEIDKEYNGSPWNLLQILANINILIGEESCEDAISRTQALSDYADWYGYGYRDNTFYKYLKDMLPVKPKSKVGHWIGERDDYGELTGRHCSNCYDKTGFVTTCAWSYCPACGAKMVEPKESEE